MQDQGEEKSPAGAQTLPETVPQSWWQSIFFIVLAAFILRLAVITIGHTYRITPRRDHFQFGWEMGRIARSIALGQGFSSPTDLPTGPSAGRRRFTRTFWRVCSSCSESTLRFRRG